MVEIVLRCDMPEADVNFVCPACGAEANMPPVYAGCYRPCPKCGQKGLVDGGLRGSGAGTPPASRDGIPPAAAARRPVAPASRQVPYRDNYVGIISVWLVAASWCISIALGLAVSAVGITPGGLAPVLVLVQFGFSLLSGLALLAGFVMSIIALVQIAAAPGTYIRGKRHASIALGLSLASFCIGASFIFLAGSDRLPWSKREPEPEPLPLQRLMAGEPRRPAVIGKQTPQPFTIALEEHNLKYVVNSREWDPRPAQTVMQGSVAEFSRKNPDMHFAIAVREDSGMADVTTDDFAAGDLAEMRIANNLLRLISQQPMELGGCKGINTLCEARFGKTTAYYSVWAFSLNGFLYKMVAIASKDKITPEVFDRESKVMFSGFGILDAGRKAAK